MWNFNESTINCGWLRTHFLYQAAQCAVANPFRWNLDYPGHCCQPISIMGYLHSYCQPIRQRYGWQQQAIRKLNCQACTFWTNPASLSQFRTAAAIRFACHWTTNVMHWAGALSFGGASRGFVSLVEKWLYHGIIAPCGSFQTCPVAKPWMIIIVLFSNNSRSIPESK